jgi:hypothetical protein
MRGSAARFAATDASNRMRPSEGRTGRACNLTVRESHSEAVWLESI